ncbi:MAG TPA: YhbY family RNA-binding protein [Candidatus Nanoarchaeia archaeon]|nr:YhbY family RNA-binding protein [Candidatus Nanoarchaeia archaeon]
MAKLGFVQLGKQGITDNFIDTLKNHLKNHQNIKISVLKSARPEGREGKKKVQEYTDKILEKLGPNYSSKVIGFTIAIKKLRKVRV